MAFATGAIWLLGESITSLVFQYGLFSGHDVVLTTVCLKAYSLALLPSTIVLILSSGLYARKSYFEPVAASLVAILFNIALNALFVFTFHWGAASVALATSISAFINCGLLYGLFKRGAAIAFSKREKGNFLRVIGWIGFSFALVYYLQGYLPAGNIISIMAIGGLYTALVFAPFVKKARKNFAGF